MSVPCQRHRRGGGRGGGRGDDLRGDDLRGHGRGGGRGDDDRCLRVPEQVMNKGQTEPPTQPQLHPAHKGAHTALLPKIQSVDTGKGSENSKQQTAQALSLVQV